VSFKKATSKHRKLWLLLSLFLAIAAIVLLSGGLSDLEFSPGERFSLKPKETPLPGAPPPSSESRGFAGLDERLSSIIGIVVIVLLPVSALYLILSPEARKKVFGMLMYTVWILVIYYLMYRFLQQNNLLELLPGLGRPPTADPTVPGTEFVPDPPQWISFVLSLGLILLLFASGTFIWWRTRSPKKTHRVEDLAKEAHRTLRELRDGADLQNAIMRCYLRMGQIVGQKRGIQRQDAMTPREFEGQLEAIGIPGESVQRLTRLFERVRYGAKPTNPAQEEEAIACLTAIIQACEEV
jgi:hypothetical protein